MSLTLSGSKAFQADFERFVGEVKDATKAVVVKITNTVGEAFNALASIKDSTYGLDSALSTVRDGGAIFAHLKGRVILPAVFSQRIDSAKNVINSTAIFSDIYYIVAGEWVDDLREQKLSKIFGNLAFTVTNGINAFLGVKEMAKISSEQGEKEFLNGLADAFAIGGFLGHIGDNVQSLIKSDGKDLSAWFSLMACATGIALPILGFAGVVNVPLILSLGFLSATFGVVSVVYRHYTEKPSSGVSLNFTEKSETFGKVLAPVSSLGALLSKLVKGDSLKPFYAAVGHIRPLASFSSGFAFISRGKDWFYADKSGRYKWQSMTPWALVKQVALTVQGGMEFIRFLSDNAISDLGYIVNSSIGRISLFNSVKDSVVALAFGCALVDDAAKLMESGKNVAAKKEKQKNWQVLSRFVESKGLGKQDFANFKDLAARLREKYAAKAQWVSTQLRVNPLNAEFLLKQERYKAYGDGLGGEFGLGAFLEERKKNHNEKLSDKLLSLPAGSSLRKGVKKEKKALHDMDVVDYASFRLKKADWAVEKFKVDQVKNIWTTTQDVFKVAVPLISLGGAFAGITAVAPFSIGFAALGFVSASIGFGKYVTDATLTAGPAPALAA